MKKPSFLRHMLVLIVAMALSSGANGQCGCVPGYFSKILQAGEVKTISSLFPGNTTATGFCFSLAENSRLVIDKDFTFSSCYFWQQTGAQVEIKDGFKGTFSDGCLLEDCSGVGSGGIQVGENARLTAPGLIIQGNGTMGVAISATTNSQINLSSPTGGTAFLGTVQSVVACQDCALVRVTDISQFNANIPIYINGRPNLHIDNCNFTGNMGGILAHYAAVGTTSPRLYIANSNFNVGTNSPSSFAFLGAISLIYTGGGVGGALSFSSSPTTGPPIIENCKANMYNAAVGYNLTYLNGVTLNNNEATLLGNASSADIRLFDVGSCPGTIITNNVGSGSTGAFSFASTGLALSDSPNCVVANNKVSDVSYGVQISGDCSTPNGFSGNQFNGSQYVGLRLAPNSTIGDQQCMANKWNGTFSLVGAQNLSSVPDNEFTVKTTVYPDMPTTNVSNWFLPNALCPEFGGGDEGESRSSEGIAAAQDIDAGISVYPNPASSQFKVTLPQNESVQYLVQLTDLAGKLVFDAKTSEGDENISIETDALSPGIYLVRVSSDKVRHVEKIIITR